MRRILFVLVSSVFALLAQDTTGSIQGVALDPTGSTVPDVRIELVNQGTQTTVTRSTGPDGNYQFSLLLPGAYTLRATSSGFRTAITTGILVEVNKTVRVDVAMQVGTVSESIEVTASAVRIDTTTAQVSTNVTQKMVTELPSSSRNALSFAELAPGVQVSGGSQVMNITGTQASVNGNRQARNVYYLDGSDNTGSFRNTALQFPNPEAVQEVNVSTSNTSAEFGKQPGGTFNVITKSGTNEFHGSGFFYLHNEALNANTWNRNASRARRALDRLKQGGGTLGGPIRRDRTFFFASYMAYRDQAAGFQNTIRFPTDALVRGDFSQFDRRLYDPDTRAPLAGNIIPPRLLDPVAQNILKLVPKVANFGDRYIWNFISPTSNNEVLGKLDHTFNSAHSLQASYFRTWGDQQQPNTAAANNVPRWGPQINVSEQHTGSIRHVWIAKNNFLVQNRFAIARHNADRTNANIGTNLADLGANWPVVQEGGRKYLPQFAVTDGLQARAGFLSLFDQYNFRFGSTASWITGRHTVKFGVEFQRDTVAQRNDYDATTLNFDGRSSSTDASGRPTGQNVFGYAMADFLMGRSSSFSTVGILDYNLNNWSNYFFLQDEWKITRKLTLSPGLRYELYQPAQEKNDRAVAFIPGHRSDLYPNAPANLAFEGDRGVPNGFTRQDRNNLAPRLGLAYDIQGDGRSVIRAGYGYYYSYNPMQIRLWSVEAPPWRPNASGGETRSLVDLWGTSRTIVYPTAPTPFTSDVAKFNYPPRLNNTIGFDQGFRTPYSVQWNVAFEREIARGFTASAAYVANRGLNQLQILPGNLPLYSPTATLGNIEQRRPIAGYSHVGIIHSRARSWYDALQLTGDMRFTRGLTTRVTYVYAKAYDIVEQDPTGNSNIQTANPANLDGERAQAGNRHVFRAFYILDLPRLSSAPKLVSLAVGGWQLSGNVYAASGDFLNVTLGEDYNFDAVAGDRPNLVGPVNYTSGSKDERSARFFDPSAFAVPADRTVFGTSPRDALVGPGTWNADLGLLKNFAIREGVRLQLRAEGFNFLNHSNLNNPNTNMRSADYGRILTRGGGRTIQLGARFLF